MKQVCMFIFSCFATLSLMAQYTVTITVNGNKDRQLSLDGQDFTIEIAVADDPVVLTANLAAGQHDLQVLQSSSGSSPGMNKTKSFALRPGYDMAIIINSNGDIELKETLKPGTNPTTPVVNPTITPTVTQNTDGGQYSAPMTDARFNQLYQDIKRLTLGPAKMSAMSSTFARAGNYFTTSQVRQLIQLVSAENNRLQLAKSSYHCITDPDNFNQLYDILFSQAAKNELTAYVNSASHQVSAPINTSGSSMQDADFTALYRSVQQQWKPGAKLSALTSAFANTNNFFTVIQAKQLIQLVSNEMNRLQLAKSSYRNIVDPANFSQVYDLFISQVNRDELAAYVNAYPR